MTGRRPGASPCPTRTRAEPTAPRPGRRPSAKPKKRKFSDPARTYAKRLERYRPGIVGFTLDQLAGLYGRPVWERRLDPTSELILTILTQNSADTNAEIAFQLLREAYPSGLAAEVHRPGLGWGGVGLPEGAPPDWAAVEFAPIQELPTSSVRAAWPTRRRRGSRPRSAGSARNAATTPSSSSGRCPRSTLAPG